MKKFFLSAIAVAAIATAFTSCKKEETAEPTKTYASISGMAYANLDETNDTLGGAGYNSDKGLSMELAPEGTKVIAQVYTGDYSMNPDEENVGYENVTYETTVGADGTYTFAEIEAYTQDVTVTIQYSDFGYDTKKWLTALVSGNPKTTVQTERNVYSQGDMTVTVVANANKVVDVTYAY